MTVISKDSLPTIDSPESIGHAAALVISGGIPGFSAAFEKSMLPVLEHADGLPTRAGKIISVEHDENVVTVCPAHP